MLLDQIQKENDIKNIDPRQYNALAEEIRKFLLDKVSASGGHLASNLGTVELTMALHLAFHFPEDKIVWDVGHQSYTHKILTGRKEGFDTLRSYGGMSGFPKRSESDCDVFNTGHSSTSISAGLGLAEARDLKKEDYAVVSVIGDGSFTGGMAFEALNNASQLKSNFIIVLNDNNMSIDKNIGGVNRALSNLRTAPFYNDLKENVKTALDRIPDVGNRLVHGISRTKNGLKQLMIPGMIFEEMDITYLGPVDGHNISQLVTAFEEARRLPRAVIVHVMTKKGKGYRLAEQYPSHFHGVSPFDLATGRPKKEKTAPTYTDFAAKAMVEIGKKDENVTAITAAMPEGTGLKPFSKQFPERFFDVGIAEQHAVTFAAGLAAGGLKPYFCVYSSFLQRAYDQIVHDVCLQHLPVRLLVDRAGLVGADGETHQGMLDVPFLETIPGMTIMAPKNGEELRAMIHFSLDYDGPLAIRYPRGTASVCLKEYQAPIEYGKWEMICEEQDIVLAAAGTMVETAARVRAMLKEKGYQVSLVNVRFLKPLDTECLEHLQKKHSLLVTMEENNRIGGFGQQAVSLTMDRNWKWHVLNTAPDDIFVTHGDVSILKKSIGIDAESICKRIEAAWQDQISDTDLPEN